jgi:iron complex transport system substrate-binding protein
MAYERIISAGGDITEIIYALEAQDRLVGVDTTSLYPEAAQKFPKVGYKRSLSTEGILGLKPDLLIYTGDAGPEAVLKQLEQANVKLIKLPENYSIDTVKKKIEIIAKELDLQKKGQNLIKDIEEKEQQLSEKIQNIGDKKTGLLILNHAGGRSLVAGKKSSGHGILEEAGIENGADNFYGFKPLNSESEIKINPDIIFISTPLAGNEEEALKIKQAIKSMPGTSITKAAKNDNIILIDPLKYIGFGVRAVDAAEDLFNYSYK